MNDNGCRDFRSRQRYTSVLLGERVVSKAAGWGSNPHARADCRRGSTEKGVRPVSGTILVRIQSSLCPDGVADCVGLSEGPGPNSIPGRDNDLDALRVWWTHDCFRSSRTRFDSSAGYFWCAITKVLSSTVVLALKEEPTFVLEV